MSGVNHQIDILERMLRRGDWRKAAEFITSSLTGTGFGTMGGEVATTDNTGAVRNILDNGVNGSMVVAGGLTVDGTLALSSPLLVNKGVKFTVLSKTSSYNMSATDCLVLADATAGAMTVTLPALNQGMLAIVKKVDSSGNAVSVALASGNIDGVSSISLGTQYESVMVVKSGISAGVVIAANAGSIL